MTVALVVFEDGRWPNLAPLTDTTPVPALAFGASCLAERIAAAAGLPLAGLVVRADALTLCRTLPATTGIPDRPTMALLVNAAALPGPWIAGLAAGNTRELLRSGDTVVAARIAGDALPRAVLRGAAVAEHLGSLGLPERSVEARIVERPWQLVEWNCDAIAADLAAPPPPIAGELHPTVARLGEAIAVDEGARLEPFVVLDARGGPIWVRRGAVLAPHTVVVGPCVVGEGTQLLGGVVSRSTLGRQCRIAGEVEESVWQGFANKRHHGFVGHSVVGEWVNLGALTTTSDLKNNYGTVRVRIAGGDVDTGTRKLGSLVGAHVKTGIGTLLPTGAIVGTGANLFGGGRFAPKAVPSFGWWDGERMDEHRPDAFLATAKTAMSRRGESLTPSDEAALRRLFDGSAGARAETRIASPARR